MNGHKRWQKFTLVLIALGMIFFLAGYDKIDDNTFENCFQVLILVGVAGNVAEHIAKGKYAATNGNGGTQ